MQNTLFHGFPKISAPGLLTVAPDVNKAFLSLWCHKINGVKHPSDLAVVVNDVIVAFTRSLYEVPWLGLVCSVGGGERSAGLRRLLQRYIIWPIVCFGGGGNIDVGVSVVGRVYLVALAQALDDVQVDSGRFHEAVLQQPAVRVRVGVTLSQHVFQGGLQEPNPCQHRQLKEDTQRHMYDITHNVNTKLSALTWDFLHVVSVSSERMT